MRTKTGTTRRARHKKILKLAKGYRLSRSRHYKTAKETVLKAGEYAFAGRKLKKRQFRRLWIMRLNAALKNFNLSYSHFIKALKKADIQLNRKMLSQLAIKEPEAFAQIVKKATGK